MSSDSENNGEMTIDVEEVVKKIIDKHRSGIGHDKIKENKEFKNLLGELSPLFDEEEHMRVFSEVFDILKWKISNFVGFYTHLEEMTGREPRFLMALVDFCIAKNNHENMIRSKHIMEKNSEISEKQAEMANLYAQENLKIAKTMKWATLIIAAATILNVTMFIISYLWPRIS